MFLMEMAGFMWVIIFCVYVVGNGGPKNHGE